MSFWKGRNHHGHEYALSISFHDDPTIFSHLRAHFGDPPQTAIYEPIPQGGLWVIAKRESEGAIAGCIRYRYVDHVDGEPIHLVDCFCVHPTWRGRRCASAMLCTLRDYATPRGMPRAVFLKEGAPIRFAHAIVSGAYWYRACGGNARMHEGLRRCPTPLAHRLVVIRQTMAPTALTLLDRGAPTQEWWIYRAAGSDGPLSVLACTQDTHQRDLDGKKMAWFTAWIVLDEAAEEAARDAIADVLPYGSVWFPTFTTSIFREGWHPDGAFHWYTYQWNTTRKVDPKVYVMVM